MKELIERLRQRAKPIRDRLRYGVGNDLRESYDLMITEAADAIERLEHEAVAYDVTIDNLKKQINDFCMDYRMKCDVETKALTVERDALAQDAQRYRWLTDNAYVGIAPHPKPHEVWCMRLPDPSGSNNLDTAIDAAIKGQS